MKSRRFFALALPALALMFGARPGVAEDLNPKQRSLVQSLKSYAESKPGMVNRIQQGSFYFKWLQSPPQGWDKAYFKLGETDKGSRFLSLQLIRKAAGGSIELVIVNDRDLNFLPEEAFRGSGRTLSDADRAIAGGLEKSKIPLTAELTNDFAVALDQLRWELNH
jgi:hypothetical protein